MCLCFFVANLGDTITTEENSLEKWGMEMELKTPLYEEHVSLAGKIVPFAGYLLPVQYQAGVIAEHMAVRQKCGLFDVSHMGEVLLSGPDAFASIQKLLTNDFTSLVPGRVRYSPMCNDDGGVIDDLLVYDMGDERYLLVVNASNHQKDVAWIKSHLSGDVRFADISDKVAQLALQGPKARDILAKICRQEDIPNRYYSFTKDAEVGGKKCLLSQTGYTGEDGFELYCAAQDAQALWQTLLKVGSEEGLIPCGLGARDTLRMEAAMPLYGHEMDETVTPFEAGLGSFVKMAKADFIGKAALQAKGEAKISRVGLRVTGRGIVREHCPLYIGERQVGQTTSGTHCPFVGGAIAMALVENAAAAIGTVLEADVRGKRIAVEVVPMPFYKRS